MPSGRDKDPDETRSPAAGRGDASPRASSPADSPTAPWAGFERPPERIGPYRILEVIGEGGMGAVYRAEQEYPIRRMVALKIIKLGMDTREVIARFEAERQAGEYGHVDAEWILANADLAALRDEPGFAQAVAVARDRYRGG